MSTYFSMSMFDNPALRYLAYAVVAMLLSVVHMVFLKYVSVQSVTPDLLLLLVVWAALMEGQYVGMIVGFGAGLLFDMLTTDVLGSNALAKTLAGFMAGYFYREGMGLATIGSYRLLLIVTFTGFLHNLVYFFFYIKPMQTSFWEFFLVNGVATTLYTTVVATFPMLLVNRRNEW